MRAIIRIEYLSQKWMHEALKLFLHVNNDVLA